LRQTYPNGTSRSSGFTLTGRAFPGQLTWRGLPSSIHAEFRRTDPVPGASSIVLRRFCSGMWSAVFSVSNERPS